MARATKDRDLSPVLAAAREWLEECLVQDRSVLSEETLWTPQLIGELQVKFVDRPDAGSDDFITKLRGQLRDASPASRKLMAEMLWALFLFPSNVTAGKKRQVVRTVWGMSEDQLPDTVAALGDKVLNGVGSAGTAYNNKRHQELSFLISLAADLKKYPPEERRGILTNYDDFLRWIATVPREGNRQFRPMLRYFCFPDRVERMSSARQMQKVLEGFEVATRREIAKWDDRKLDEELLRLRNELEREHPGVVLDFYDPPLAEKWQSPDVPEEDEEADVLREPVDPSWTSATEIGAPFSDFFASLEEANWGFDILRDTLSTLGVDPADAPNDRRLCLSVSERADGFRLRLNFGKWAILTFRSLSESDERIEYVCRQDLLPSPISSDVDNFFADRIDGKAFSLASAAVSDFRSPESATRAAFVTSLSDVAHRFEAWGASPFQRAHQPQVLRMVYDRELRDRLLRSGLVLAGDSRAGAAPASTGAAYWWLNANPKMWDFRTAPIGSTQTYTSHNEAGHKRQKFKYFSLLKPGDFILGYVTSPDKALVGLCKVTKGLHGPADDERIEFEKIEHFAKPVTWNELQARPELAACEPLSNNQGSLFRVKEEEYEAIRALVDDATLEVGLVTPAPFTVDDALTDLFMPRAALDQILRRLKRKKAIILTGPPGVGKTFVARRLAFTLMRAKDDSRVTTVQFHPSYGYEDFVQGYRPRKDGGLELRDGVLVQFARRARTDPKHDWFLIIDEINRGNLAKVFGELLMLIEADKRGPAHGMPLTYSDAIGDKFDLPENLYFIGTMNTADRSLAMVDYALRRRFAFASVEPAFDSPELEAWLRRRNAPQALINRLRSNITRVNAEIEKERDLGRGFRIGHSYFCPPEGETVDEHWFEDVVRGEIEPLLDEYFDSPERVARLVRELLA